MGCLEDGVEETQARVAAAQEAAVDAKMLRVVCGALSARKSWNSISTVNSRSLRHFPVGEQGARELNARVKST